MAKETNEWTLRYKKPQNELHFRPKVHFKGQHAAEPDFVCIAESRGYPDGMYATVTLPEEMGYKVLSIDSDHWELWSPDSVVVGVRQNLATVPKRFDSIKPRVAAAREALSKEAQGLIGKDLVKATEGDRVGRMELVKAARRGKLTEEEKAAILAKRGLSQEEQEPDEELQETSEE